MRILTAGAALAAVLGATDAYAFCRVVTEQGAIPPIIEPQQAVLLVLQRNVPVGGPVCAGMDGGGVSDPDGGPLDPDGGPLGLDPSGDDAASFDPDAGPLDPDAGGPLDSDGGALFTPPDLSASCAPRRGNAVTMIVQPTFSTQPGVDARFALLMVTPDVPTVTLAQTSLFPQLAAATAPLIEHQQKFIEDPKLGKQCAFDSGCGAGFSDPSRGTPPNYTPPSPGGSDAGLPADVSTLGAYELAVLGGADLASVEAWLVAHNYYFDDNDVAALAPYVNRGWTVTAVRVRSVPVAKIALTPIAFTYESDVLRLPVSLSREPSGGNLPLTVYIAADARYDFPGGAVPFADYSSSITDTTFLTRNDLTVDLSAPIDLDPIALREPDTTHHDTITVIDEVHVPVTDCGCRGFGGCGCDLAGRRAVPAPLVVLLILVAAGLVRRALRKPKPR